MFGAVEVMGFENVGLELGVRSVGGVCGGCGGGGYGCGFYDGCFGGYGGGKEEEEGREGYEEGGEVWDSHFVVDGILV